MKNLTLLIKPASGLCNMRCKYCFYQELVEGEKMGVMERQMSHKLIDRVRCEVTDSVTFMFQGGEPTLAGLDYFKDFTEYADKVCPSQLAVDYAIQTNGLALDEEWARFLKERDFLVGLSLDGGAQLHDRNRVDAAGKGTFNRVMGAKRILEQAGVPFNILCVVTSAAARSPGALYSWYKKQGLNYLQFIACLDPSSEERGQEGFSLTPERYGQFLCQLFDLWYNDWKRGEYVSIRLFDDYVRALAGLPTSTCATSGKCGSYIVVEYDGRCYPCDFYVEPRWYLGNITQDSLTGLRESEKAVAFIDEEKPMRLCSSCKYVSLCRGGCKRDCQRGSMLGENYYCQSFKALFDHAWPNLLEMAQAEQRTAGR